MYYLCAEFDNGIAQQAITNYDQKTFSTTVNGVQLILDEKAIAKAFGLLQEEKPKDQLSVSDAAISKLLKEDELP